ncbi:MAG TPA: PEP-CTERM sorting domain-containing protein, partial [Phycisphaerae bacterium]|nr:PEP-CTERM sorting domain-containing protein [Phycisphaerae bacterium]
RRCRQLAALLCCSAGLFASSAGADTFTVGPGLTADWWAAGTGSPDNTGITITNESPDPMVITVEKKEEELLGGVEPGFVLLDLTDYGTLTALRIRKRPIDACRLRVRMEYDPARLTRKGLRARDLVLMRRVERADRRKLWRPMARVMARRGIEARRLLGRPVYRAGYYGVCMDETYVWGVLREPGDYAIGVLPEPASLACMAAGGGLLMLRRRRQPR